MLNLITPNWSVPQSIKAFSTTRKGGNSSKPYDSLNLGGHVGDDVESVKANRALLPVPLAPCWLNQVHSTETIEFAETIFAPLTADGCFSNRPQQVCVVMTADCLPVLLTDSEGSFVAAIHCGWKGMANGILEKFLKTRKNLNGVIAWLGPAIGPNAFEVDKDVLAVFPEEREAFQSIVNKGISQKKYQANIFQIATMKLQRLGVSQIYSEQQCTFSDSENFFSYRRDGTTGRMASFIWIE